MNRSHQDVSHIDFKDLKRQGFHAIAFDKDNTLTAPYMNEIHPPYLEAWKWCKEIFGNQVVIVSNSAGSCDDFDYKQAIEIEKTLGVPVLRSEEKVRCR